MINEFEEFEETLKMAVKRVRRILEVENVGGFRLCVEVSGLTHSGDLELMFTIGERYDSKLTRGGRLEAVLREFVHRMKWSERNRPLLVAPSGQAAEPPE